jgi:hypothetical protein
MTWSSVAGVAALIVLISFIVFAFRQGEKVKRPPEGTPPETGGYGSADHNSGHMF